MGDNRPPFSEDATDSFVAENETAPRRAPWYSGTGFATDITETPNFPWKKTTKTSFDVLMHTAELFPELNAVATQVDNKYEFINYKDFARNIRSTADSLRSKLGVKKGMTVGLMSKNRVEWVIMNFAGNALGAVTIPIYYTQTNDTLVQVITHGEMSVIAASAEMVEKLEVVLPRCPATKLVVLMDSGAEVLEDVRGRLAKVASGVRVEPFWELVGGGNPDATFEPNASEDLAQIMYTSGTTGVPKGVMITNQNMVSEVAGLRLLENLFKCELRPGYRTLSYLPNAHIFAQALEIAFFSLGICVYYPSGSIKNLSKDIALCNPHALPAVPRILSRFEEGVKKKVAERSPLSRMMFWGAFGVQKMCWLRFHFRIGLLDKLIFNKVRAGIAPDVKLIFSGSAPLEPDTHNFIAVAFNAQVVQGFGMTETCAAVSASEPTYGKAGTIGGPLANAELKLRDVPEMGYSSKDLPYPRGELLVRGTTIFKGYYKNETATKAELSEDGWFSTGDVAQLNADGSFSIIDRKKNIFKLSQGEYVAAEQVEAVFSKSAYLAQFWVYGDSAKSQLVAVAVPDRHAASVWAADNNVADDIAALAENKEFKAAILADLRKLHKEFQLKGYEKIAAIHLEADLDSLGQGFTVENGLATPSMKLKRPAMKEKYAKTIDAMYAALG